MNPVNVPLWQKLYSILTLVSVLVGAVWEWLLIFHCCSPPCLK